MNYLNYFIRKRVLMREIRAFKNRLKCIQRDECLDEEYKAQIVLNYLKIIDRLKCELQKLNK